MELTVGHQVFRRNDDLASAKINYKKMQQEKVRHVFTFCTLKNSKAPCSKPPLIYGKRLHFFEVF